MLLRSPSSISEMTMDGFTILWCSGNRRVTIIIIHSPYDVDLSASDIRIFIAFVYFLCVCR